MRISKLKLVSILIIIITAVITLKLTSIPTPIHTQYQIHTYTQKISLSNNLGADFEKEKVSKIQTKIYGRALSITLPKSIKKNIDGKYIMYLPNLKQGVYTIKTNKNELTIKIGTSREVISNPNLSTCPQDIKNEENCLVSYYINLYDKNNNLNSILTDILKNKDTTPGLAGYCHNVIHDLGIYYVLKNKTLEGLDVEQASICDNALLHGAEEGLALSLSNEELAKQFTNLCQGAVIKKLDNCEHGLGHLAYWRTGDFKLGMQLCLLLENPKKEDAKLSAKIKRERDAINCADGVAMSELTDLDTANSDQSSKNVYEEKNVVTEPIKQCIDLHDNLLTEGCLSNINFFYHRGDEPQVKKLCDALADPNHAKCYISLGRLAGTYDA